MLNPVARLWQRSSNSQSMLYIYKRLFKYAKPYLFRALIAVLLTIPVGALDAVLAYSLRPYLDGVLVKQSISKVSLVPLAIVGFTILQGSLTYLSIYLNGWLGTHMVNDIRRELFEKLQTMDVRYFDQTTSGAIIQEFFTDPGQLQTNVLNNIKDFLTRLFSSLSLMSVLLLTSWKLALIAISILLCILFPSTLIRKTMRKLSGPMNDVAKRMLSFYNETGQGIRVIYAYNLPERRAEQFNHLQRIIYYQNMKISKLQGRMTPSMHIIASIGIAIIIWYGSHLVVMGKLTTGGFVSFLAALIMLYNPIKNMAGTVLATQASLLAAGRIMGLVDSLPEVRDIPEAQVLETIRSEIAFDNVTFAYEPGRPVPAKR